MPNKSFSKILKTLILGAVFSFSFFLFTNSAQAAILSPGQISSCGELAAPGTYTLSASFDADPSLTSNTCFVITSDNVTLNGNHHTVTTTGGGLAIDARQYNNSGDPTSGLLDGGNAFTNLNILNINFGGFTGGGVDASGGADWSNQGSNGGWGGNSGNVTVVNSTMTDINASGGNDNAEGAYGYGAGSGSTITVSDSTVGNINASGGSLNGSGTYVTPGNGGSVSISNSTIGTSVTANSGNDNNSGQNSYYTGGNGGTIYISGTNINLDNTTVSAVAGIGDTINGYGNGTPGTLTIVDSGTTTHTNTSISSLSDLNINGTDYGYYPGGSWPLFPGSISTCGAISFPGTYTLSQDITGVSGTCFTVSAEGVTIDGAGHTITGVAGGYGIDASDPNNDGGNGHSLTVKNITLSGFSWGVNTSGANGYQNGYNAPVGGGSGGNLTIESSNVSGVVSAGGSGPDDVGYSNSCSNGGNGGSISLTNSTFAYNIQVNGGNGGGSFGCGGTGGNGGNLTVSGSNINFSNLAINISGGVGGSNWSDYSVGGGGVSGALMLGNFGRSVWAQLNLGYHYWTSVTSSSDGTKLAAVDSNNGYIYTSTDSGAHWTQRTSPGQHQWRYVTSSSDGTKLAATVQGGYIYTSTDSGSTWTQQTSSGQHNWWFITSSSDGTKLAAGELGGYIYTSTDSGAHWTQQTGSGQHGWYGTTSSSDGTKLAAVDCGGYIYTSSDYGVTWTQQTGSGQHSWFSITSSSDGTKLAAGDMGGYIYTSSNSGVTWTAQTSAGKHNWRSITSSSDGTKLAAADQGGYIYTSIDSGVTWILQIDSGSPNWFAITSSSDGVNVVAGDGSGYIYRSNNPFQTTGPSTISHLNTGLSSISHLVINNTDWGAYPGGSWPLFPGSISSCGTITFPGTYTLSQDITGVSGACFTVLADGVTIDGAGHTVTMGGGYYGIDASSNGTHSITVNNITITGFPNQGSFSIKADGASGGYNSDGTPQFGTNGGNITIASSTLGTISSSGGTAADDNNWTGVSASGGSAGTITITNSTVSSIIGNGGNGGYGIYSNGGNGGNGSAVTISGSNIDLTNMSIYVGAGAGGTSIYSSSGSNGTLGSLSINYTGTVTANSTTLHSNIAPVTFTQGSSSPVTYSLVISTDTFNGASISSTPRTLYYEDDNTTDPSWDNLGNWFNDSSYSSPTLIAPRDGDTVYIDRELDYASFDAHHSRRNHCWVT